uniref:Uncharacterized protein n=1 Tax=Podarcis muralis TaxID=64176 RepID=A0A670IUG2_PODMU
KPKPRVAARKPKPRVSARKPKPRVAARKPKPRVAARKPKPRVSARKPKPRVAARKPKPRVAARKPKPRVSARKPKPRVSARKPKPRVSIWLLWRRYFPPPSQCIFFGTILTSVDVPRRSRDLSLAGFTSPLLSLVGLLVTPGGARSPLSPLSPLQENQVSLSRGRQLLTEIQGSSWANEDTDQSKSEQNSSQ